MQVGVFGCTTVNDGHVTRWVLSSQLCERCSRCVLGALFVHIHTNMPLVAFMCVFIFLFVFVCLLVSLKLREVERRGHSEPVTKLIRQIPVTRVTFSQLRFSAHTMWTALLFLSFVCFLLASFPALAGFKPVHFFSKKTQMSI